MITHKSSPYLLKRRSGETRHLLIGRYCSFGQFSRCSCRSLLMLPCGHTSLLIGHCSLLIDLATACCSLLASHWSFSSLVILIIGDRSLLTAHWSLIIVRCLPLEMMAAEVTAATSVFYGRVETHPCLTRTMNWCNTHTAAGSSNRQ